MRNRIICFLKLDPLKFSPEKFMEFADNMEANHANLALYLKIYFNYVSATFNTRFQYHIH